MIAAIIIFIFSVIASNPLFSPGMFYTHDGEIHTVRMAQFHKALTDGHFPVRLTPNRYYGLGYPLFNFAYVAPYYMSSLAKLATSLPYQDIYKLELILSIFLSGLFCFILLRQHFSHLASLVGSLFYLYTPYRFANLYMRGALGEALFFIYIPLLFLSPQVFKKNKWWGFIYTSMVVFLSITTHPLLFFMFLIPLIIYSFIILNKLGSKFLLNILFGLLLCAFYLIPMIFDKKFTLIDTSYLYVWKDHFLNIPTLLHIPISSANLSTPFQTGIFGLFVLVLSIFKFKKNRIFIFFLALALCGIFLASSYSFLIWQHFPFIHYLVFPWRFLSFIILSITFLTGFFIDSIRGNTKYLAALLMIILIVVPSRHFIKKQGEAVVIPDAYFLSYQKADSDDYYYLPKNISTNIKEVVNPTVEIVEGEGQVVSYSRLTHKIMLNLDNKTDIILKLPALYFPGWQAVVDEKRIAIDPNYNNLKDLNGLITIGVPSGKHQVLVFFSETPFRKTANLISLIAFILLLLTAIYKRRSLSMMNGFSKNQRGIISVAAALLIAVASVAVIALTYSAARTPTRTTPQAQTGRCFWIEAEFEKRADGLGYDPYVLFKSDDNNGFDDIYLTRDGALVAGPNRWNKSNGPFVYYPQYTGGILISGQTISYNGRDDNCGARGNSSVIACSVDQNGNLQETGSCKTRGGGGATQPTAVPTQPPSNKQTNVYLDPSTVNPGGSVIVTATGSEQCSTNISNPPDSRGGFSFNSCQQIGGFSCSGNTKDANPCWWQWRCTAGQTVTTYTVTFSSLSGGSNCTSTTELTIKSTSIGQPQPTATPTKPVGAAPTATPTKPVGAAPTKTPTPIPTNTPTPLPTVTPIPAPTGATCGYLNMECCPEGQTQCYGENVSCHNQIFPFLGKGTCKIADPTPIPPTPTPTKPVGAAPTTIPTQTATNTLRNVVNRIVAPQKIQPIEQPSNISGKVTVNNTLAVGIVEIKTALYKIKGDPNAIAADARSETYQYNDVADQEYFIKAWVRDQNGNWYQNAPCTAVGDDYDCVVKPGEQKNLTVNIGPQGLRGIFVKTQNISTNFAQNLRQAIINLPGGSIVNMFLMTAF